MRECTEGVEGRGVCKWCAELHLPSYPAPQPPPPLFNPGHGGRQSQAESACMHVFLRTFKHVSVPWDVVCQWDAQRRCPVGLSAHDCVWCQRKVVHACIHTRMQCTVECTQAHLIKADTRAHTKEMKGGSSVLLRWQVQLYCIFIILCYMRELLCFWEMLRM